MAYVLIGHPHHIKRGNEIAASIWDNHPPSTCGGSTTDTHDIAQPKMTGAAGMDTHSE